jgi:hypothetical protein
LDQLEKEVFLHFPFQEYGQDRGLSDTLIFYKPAILKKKLEQIETYKTQLSAIRPTKNWAPEKQVLLAELKAYLQLLESDLLNYQTDPSHYNLGGILAQNLSNPLHDKKQKSQLCLQNLKQSSKYYRTAQLCLAKPEPDRLQLAIEKQVFTIKFMENTLRDSIQQWKLSPDQAKAFNKELYIAHLACKDYIAFCNSLLFEKREAALFSK